MLLRSCGTTNAEGMRHCTGPLMVVLQDGQGNAEVIWSLEIFTGRGVP